MFLGSNKIYLKLNSLDAGFAAVNGALTNKQTVDAIYDSDYKIIIADMPAERTGSLAAIARENRGSSLFKDEYVGVRDFRLRGEPATALSNSPYANKVLYIRRETSYALGTGAPTDVTHGTGTGKNFGDAAHGVLGWDAIKGALTGPLRVYIVEQGIIRDELVSGGRPVASVGEIDVNFAGTVDNPTEVRFDYPEIVVDDKTLDRGVLYAGLLLSNTSFPFGNSIVNIAYTESVALVSGDIGKAITADTSGDTGTILGFNGTNIWIGTDGNAANDFASTGGETFTITDGTGSGTQSGASTALSGNSYWRAGMPSVSVTRLPWVYDCGSHFGNAVDITGYKTVVGSAGHDPVTVWTQTVQAASGVGGVLTEQTTVAGCDSNAGTFYNTGGAGGVAVVHLPDGSDPTHRVMTGSFGNRLNFGGVEHVHLIGSRFRQYDNWHGLPGDNFEMSDFSQMHSKRSFRISMSGWNANRTGWNIHHGYMAMAPAGFYPNANASGGTFEGITLQYLVGEDLGQADTAYPDSDGHVIGWQHTVKDVTAQYIYGRRTGQPIHPYQTGGYVTNPILHEWGTHVYEHMDFDNTDAVWEAGDDDSGRSALHLGGDPGDDANIGNGKADPPTTLRSFVMTFRSARIRGTFRVGIRNKWPDHIASFENIDIDDCTNVGVQGTGNNFEGDHVIKVPYSETTPLAVGDIQRDITAATSGDTGKITDFTDTHVFVATDGTATNDFASTSGEGLTITGGTGVITQNGVGVAEPERAHRTKLRKIKYGPNIAGNAVDLVSADATDYVIDSDESTVIALASATVMDGDTTTNWQARSRAGNGSRAVASVFDPTLTRTDP